MGNAERQSRSTKNKTFDVMNHINKIIAVNPYTILLDWNDGEEKLIDFKKTFCENNGIYKKLLMPEIFTKVQTNGRSLYWSDLATIIDENGDKMTTDLDFCADMIYENSQVVEVNN
ncbi:MAG: DUF2442 domain-containing protein [Deinococcales bacterium]|nr:DUF2442 domain-containing protein [Chitinophagaceae bacterium]